MPVDPSSRKKKSARQRKGGGSQRNTGHRGEGKEKKGEGEHKEDDAWCGMNKRDRKQVKQEIEKIQIKSRLKKKDKKPEKAATKEEEHPPGGADDEANNIYGDIVIPEWMTPSCELVKNKNNNGCLFFVDSGKPFWVDHSVNDTSTDAQIPPASKTLTDILDGGSEIKEMPDNILRRRKDTYEEMEVLESFDKTCFTREMLASNTVISMLGTHLPVDKTVVQEPTGAKITEPTEEVLYMNDQLYEQKPFSAKITPYVRTNKGLCIPMPPPNSNNHSGRSRRKRKSKRDRERQQASTDTQQPSNNSSAAAPPPPPPPAPGPDVSFSVKKRRKNVSHSKEKS